MVDWWRGFGGGLPTGAPPGPSGGQQGGAFAPGGILPSIAAWFGAPPPPPPPPFQGGGGYGYVPPGTMIPNPIIGLEHLAATIWRDLGLLLRGG